MYFIVFIRRAIKVAWERPFTVTETSTAFIPSCVRSVFKQHSLSSKEGMAMSIDITVISIDIVISLAFWHALGWLFVFVAVRLAVLWLGLLLLCD